MNRLDNLIPFNQMDPHRHREVSRRGGIASGKARKEKAKLRSALRICMLQHAVEQEERKWLVEILIDLLEKEMAKDARLFDE